jgi:hypothetical protein
MKGYIKISEIGNSATIKYRATLLGIVPLKEKRFGEICYSIEDAEKIVGYRPKVRVHNIVFYEILEIILNDDKLRYNTPYASKIMGITETKLLRMLDEFNKTGCFVVESKINNEQYES